MKCRHRVNVLDDSFSSFSNRRRWMWVEPSLVPSLQFAWVRTCAPICCVVELLEMCQLANLDIHCTTVTSSLWYSVWMLLWWQLWYIWWAIRSIKSAVCVYMVLLCLSASTTATREHSGFYPCPYIRFVYIFARYPDRKCIMCLNSLGRWYWNNTDIVKVHVQRAHMRRFRVICTVCHTVLMVICNGGQ